MSVSDEVRENCGGSKERESESCWENKKVPPQMRVLLKLDLRTIPLVNTVLNLRKKV